MTTIYQVTIWGLLAALSFLVLSLGYRILTPANPSIIVLLAIAIPVGLAGALLTRGLAHRFNWRVQPPNGRT